MNTFLPKGVVVKTIGLVAFLFFTLSMALAQTDVTEVRSVFSVAADMKVKFSTGNLYYDGSGFKFEKNQWDFASNWDQSHVSHFKWSDVGHAVVSDDVIGGKLFCSSGFSVIGEVRKDWRTLSGDEWVWLLGLGDGAVPGENCRANATSLRGWKELAVSGTANVVKGLVVLPDDSMTPLSEIKTTDDLAASGAVFFPAAGYRNGAVEDGVGTNGFYWSSSSGKGSELSAYSMLFCNSGILPQGCDSRRDGFCVRLARVVGNHYVNGSFSIAAAENTVGGELGIKWSDDDVIYVYDGNRLCGTLDCRSHDGTTATFAGDIYVKGTPKLSFFRYGKDIAVGDDGSATTDFSSQDGKVSTLKDKMVFSKSGVAFKKDGKYEVVMDAPCSLAKLNLNDFSGNVMVTGMSSTGLSVSKGGVITMNKNTSVNIIHGNGDFHLVLMPTDEEVAYWFTDNSVDGLVTCKSVAGELLASTDGGARDVKALYAKEVETASSHVFSTSADSKVLFTKGNLVRCTTKNEWQMFANQWQCDESWNGADNCHLSLFYWSKDASISSDEKYKDAAATDSDMFFTNATEVTAGTEIPDFRILSSSEWNHLLNGRHTSTVSGTADARYAKIKVSGVCGLLIFPDKFEWSNAMGESPIVNSSDAAFSPDYTTEQFGAMESAGAVFVPAAGDRNGSSVSNVGNIGSYWSNSPKGTQACCLGFDTDKVDASINKKKNSGYCVRLVRDVPKPVFSVSPDMIVEFSEGNLYWDGSAFKFEKNQWDLADSWNPNHVSHFKWSGAEHAASSDDVFNETLFCASNFTVHGNNNKDWRTLSKDEWNWLLGPGDAANPGENCRANATSLCGWKELTVPGTNNNVNGLVILPDGCTISLDEINSTADLDAAGAVFFPAVGSRNGENVDGVGSNCLYWSSTPDNESELNAYSMLFYSDGVFPQGYDSRANGYCIRLVRGIGNHHVEGTFSIDDGDNTIANALNIKWNGDDVICVYDGNKFCGSLKYRKHEGSTATFTGDIFVNGKPELSFYRYGRNVTIAEDGSATISFATQDGKASTLRNKMLFKKDGVAFRKDGKYVVAMDVPVALAKLNLSDFDGNVTMTGITSNGLSVSKGGTLSMNENSASTLKTGKDDFYMVLMPTSEEVTYRFTDNKLEGSFIHKCVAGELYASADGGAKLLDALYTNEVTLANSYTFSTSDDTKVRFTKGNLVRNTVTNTWQMFEYQCGTNSWDPVHISHFSRNGDAGASYSDAKIPDFRTLSSAEWDYLLNTRYASTINGTANARYAKVKVNGTCGLLLFPDSFEWNDDMGTAPTINKSDAPFSPDYTYSQFKIMESDGAVFIPAAGLRKGSSVSNVGDGDYWSYSPNDDKASGFGFNTNGFSISDDNDMNSGYSVRLVKEVPKPMFSVSADKKVEFSGGNLFYDGSAFRFEKTQWNLTTSWNANHVSLFKWSDAEHAVTADVSYSGTLFCMSGFTVSGDIHDDWRVLSRNEWVWLLGPSSGANPGVNCRDNAINLCGWKELTVSGTNDKVKGLLILPDESMTSLNEISTTDDLENAGAVFLPAEGSRSCTDVYNVGASGRYWSANPYGTSGAYYILFEAGYVLPEVGNFRHGGCCVRLVR